MTCLASGSRTASSCRGQGDVQGGDVLLEPLDPLGARDRHERDAEPLLLGVHPGQRHLRGGHALGVGHRPYRVDDGQVGLAGFAREARVAAAEVPGVQRAQVDGGGQEAAAERRVGHEADAELAHGADRVLLHVAGPERVLGLHRGDRVHRVRAAQQLAGDLGQAQVADLALGHEFGHRADGLLDLGRLRRPVQVVQVDDVDAQPGQRRLAGPLDVGGLAADDAVRVAGRPVDAELRGQLHLVAPVCDAAADQHLVVAGAVDVGGVDERHAEVERAVDGRDRLVPVGGAVPLAHPHAAQALCGHGELA